MLRLARAAVPALYPRIEAALSPGTRAVVADAIPATWVPIAIDVEVMEAVAGRLGPTTTAQLVRERQREEMGSALFNGFVQTVMRLSGASPVTMVKQLPAGWKQLFRDCGTIEVLGIAEQEARAALRDLPPECLASQAWMSGIPAGMTMLYDLVGVKGTAELDPRPAADGSVTIVFRWLPA